MHGRRRAPWAIGFAVSLFIANKSVADQPGDLIVACSDPIGGHAAILDIDPSTRQETVISSGGLLEEPDGVCIDAAGNIIVSDYGGNFGGSQGRIIRINPTTGKQTLISSGGNMIFPDGIAIDSSGNLFTCPTSVTQASGEVLKVNPITGAQTIVASGPPLSVATGLDIDKNGNYFVSDWQDNSYGGTNVVEVNPMSGAQKIVWTGYAQYGAYQICNNVLQPGNLLMAFTSWPVPNPSILDINPLTDSTTVISQNGLLTSPVGITQDSLGNIFVADVGTNSSNGSIIEINPSGGQTFVAAGLDGPEAIAVVVPEPAALTLVAVTCMSLLGTRRFPNRAK
jgi:streptogramin lyase